MVEKIVENRVLFYFAGVTILLGVVLKLIAGITLKRLVKAASNMSKSNHALMRLIRAKFEHACMVSDKVQNVPAFVEKYMYEYKVLGMSLFMVQQLSRTMIWLCGITSFAGGGLSYSLGEPVEVTYAYIILGGAGVVFLLLLQVTSNEKQKQDVVKMYMVDFLENTYAHRYEKIPHRSAEYLENEIVDEPVRVPVQEPVYEPGSVPKREPVHEPERLPGVEPQRETVWAAEPEKQTKRPTFVPEPELQTVQAAKIREILEEFLT